MFDKYLTVCQAYTNARKRVEEKFGGFQAKKIIMLTNPPTDDQTLGNHCGIDDVCKLHNNGLGPMLVG